MQQQTQPTTLYRHFDADGRLLYVGISKSALRRLASHEETSAWVQSISSVTVERFPCRSAAAEAEKLAIQSERPAYNVVGQCVAGAAAGASQELQAVLWANVRRLMVGRYGTENLTRLATEAGIGPGTATRIKQATTSVGLDVIAKVATVFGVAPWQLLAPGLGIDK